MVWGIAVFVLTLVLVALISYRVGQRKPYCAGQVMHVPIEKGTFITYLEVFRRGIGIQVNVVVRWKHWLSKDWATVHRERVF